MYIDWVALLLWVVNSFEGSFIYIRYSQHVFVESEHGNLLECLNYWVLASQKCVLLIFLMSKFTANSLSPLQVTPSRIACEFEENLGDTVSISVEPTFLN